MVKLCVLCDMTNKKESINRQSWETESLTCAQVWYMHDLFLFLNQFIERAEDTQ